MDKYAVPTEQELRKALGDTVEFWHELVDYTHSLVPRAKDEWKFGGKYGWSFRVSDGKRVVVYLLPRSGFFKAAMMFGKKATGEVLSADIDESIKEELRTAREYIEGRGIRIPVSNRSPLDDIRRLIGIKVQA